MPPASVGSSSSPRAECDSIRAAPPWVDGWLTSHTSICSWLESKEVAPLEVRDAALRDEPTDVPNGDSEVIGDVLDGE